MPEPDLILELGLGGRPCPTGMLQGVQDAAKAGSPFGEHSRALATCSDQEQTGGTILLVGVWADDGGASKAQLTNDLIAAGSLTSGIALGLALRFTTAAIKYLAAVAYGAQPKKLDEPIGFIRLNNDIDVKVITDQIVTEVAGQWKVRFAPNVSFTINVQDLMSLQTPYPGASPQLAATTSKELSPDVSKYGFLISYLSPALGGLILWKGGDFVASVVSPPSFESTGQSLAAQWPLQILTNIAPPDLLGKLELHWSQLKVGDRGILTRGYFLPLERTPVALIEGPTSISVKIPTNSARVTYQVSTQDLRGTLRIRWSIDGVQAGKTASQEVNFNSPGLDPRTLYRQISVLVSDGDGLTARQDLRVKFEVTVPEGSQPF